MISVAEVRYQLFTVTLLLLINVLVRGHINTTLFKPADILKSSFNAYKHGQAHPPPQLPDASAKFFDIGGLITTFGLKQGASMLGLVAFPILLPLMILFGAALFIISVFGGTAPLITAGVAGRRSDLNINEPFKMSPPSSARIKAMYQVLMKEEKCIEKATCEIFSQQATSRITREILRLLQGLTGGQERLKNVEDARIRGTSCSIFKCNLKNTELKSLIMNND